MLRRVLLGLGFAALAGSALFALAGISDTAVSLLFIGLALTAGILYEGWRYKRPQTRAEARGNPTGERFIDPESGHLIEVYFDPASGERTYVEVEAQTPPRDPAAGA